MFSHRGYSCLVLRSYPAFLPFSSQLFSFSDLSPPSYCSSSLISFFPLPYLYLCCSPSLSFSLLLLLLLCCPWLCQHLHPTQHINHLYHRESPLPPPSGLSIRRQWRRSSWCHGTLLLYDTTGQTSQHPVWPFFLVTFYDKCIIALSVVGTLSC